MAIQNTDLFMVSQNGTNYQLDAGSIATRIVSMNPNNLWVAARGGTTYQVTAGQFRNYLEGNSSNVLDSDLFLVSRAGTLYTVNAAQIKSYANIDAETVYITSNVNNVNVASLFTSWGNSRQKRLFINPGVTVGSTNSGAAAMVVPAGSVGALTINNNGSVIGAGGGGNSGTGGTAMAIQGPVTINNQGTLGGGGGGGGQGGTGGTGVYQVPVVIGLGYSGILEEAYTGCPEADGPTRWLCGCTNACIDRYGSTYGGAAVYAAPPCGYTYFGSDLCNPVCKYSYGNYNFIAESWTCSYNGTQNIYTSGGAGGAGGRGAGSDGGATGGAGGAPGGTNAGFGGTGGTGGGIGNNGNTGGTGANGNAGAGAGGAGGGLAGYYLTGNGFVTWASTGTRLGRVA